MLRLLRPTEPALPRARPFLLLFTILSLSLSSACSKFASKRLSETERRERISRFPEVIESAGSSEVWLKNPRGRASRSTGADITHEVLVASLVFDAVLTAIGRESARQGLETQINEARAQGRWRSVQIRLLLQRELVGQWHLREVQQLRRAAIVIDDLGSDPSIVRKLLELPYPLTLSVLPHFRYSVEIAEKAHRSGHEVMLHLPMQPEAGSPVAPGPGEIKVGMSSARVASIIEQDLASVPYSTGVNNHMGSRATADPALMAKVMEVLAEHGLYFVDSRTTPASEALDLARHQGIPAFYRSVFLDDTETVAYSLEKLREFRRTVEKQGAALAIGHPYPTTLAALAQFSPEFERDDIQLVSVSELVRLPEVSRLSPPRRVAPFPPHLAADQRQWGVTDHVRK